MKKLLLISKIVLIAIFGVLGTLSIMMFPFLIGNEDAQTSIVGYSYYQL